FGADFRAGVLQRRRDRRATGISGEAQAELARALAKKRPVEAAGVDDVQTARSGMTIRSERWAHVSLLAPGVLWLLAFVVAPFAFAVVISFWTSSIFGLTPDFQFGNYVRVFSNPVYRDLILKTLRVAFVTTCLALLLSYPMAYLLSVMSGRAKAIMTLALFLPFWTSYVVRSFVWLPILGTNGAINRALL